MNECINCLKRRNADLQNKLAKKRKEFLEMQQSYLREHQRFIELEKKFNKSQIELHNRIVSNHEWSEPSCL